MKEQKQVEDEAQRLLSIFMEPSNKKPIRDEAYIKYHTLQWVLRTDDDIVQKRLREINATRNNTPKSK